MDRGDRSLTEIGQVTKTRLHWTPGAFLSTVWSMAPSGEVTTQPATAYMQRTCDCEIQIDFNLRGTWTSWKCHFCVNGTWQFIIIASHMVVTHVITSDSTGRAFKVHSLIEFCYLPSCSAGSSQLETSSRVPTVINRTHTFCVLLVHK